MSVTAYGITWTQLADFWVEFPSLIRAERKARGLTLRQAGAQIGISHSQLSRIELGAGFDSSVMPKILLWMDGV
jgi:transcriptional regulator with XRE-family HTH domain